MTEILQNIFQYITVRVISRYGVLGEQEVVIVANIPRRGVAVSHMDIPGFRCKPTADTLGGLFTITSRDGYAFTLENRVNRIKLSGVPRKSIRKIIGSDLYD